MAHRVLCCDRFGTWIRPDQRRTVLRWCDWADAVLASPGQAVLVHGDFHGDNQVWDRDELRLVVDFATAGAAEPEYELRRVKRRPGRRDLANFENLPVTTQV